MGHWTRPLCVTVCVLTAVMVLLVALSACGSRGAMADPVDKPTEPRARAASSSVVAETAAATAAATATRTASPTASATAPPSPTCTSSPSATPEPTATASPLPSDTPSPSPTATQIPTRTPTPLFVLLEDRETLSRYVWSLGEATPTPTAIPAVLLGKIGFKSSMIDWERIYVVNPDGSDLALLLDRWPYQAALDRERYSRDGQFRAYQAYGRHGLDLFMMTLDGQRNYQLTFVGDGVAYDPSWAPDGLRVAFASNQEGDDDIFVVDIRSREYPNPRTDKLVRDEGWESDKRPSFSPDGQQIVFQSNRSGMRQIWIMNADGTGVRRLVAVEADCWQPVWFKP